MIDEDRYRRAPTFAEFLRGVEKNRELWHAVYERASIPDGVIPEKLRQEGALGGKLHLLALAADWCGDAVNLLPVVARLVEAVPDLAELRVLERDQNPDLMDAHLTGDSRAIPVIMILDQDLEECAWWGPRPGEIQKWVLEEGLEMPSGDRYKEVRRWYVRDRGRTTVEELLELFGECENEALAA